MMRIKDIPLNVGSFMRMRLELLLFVLNEFSHVELVKIGGNALQVLMSQVVLLRMVNRRVEG